MDIQIMFMVRCASFTQHRLLRYQSEGFETGIFDFFENRFTVFTVSLKRREDPLLNMSFPFPLFPPVMMDVQKGNPQRSIIIAFNFAPDQAHGTFHGFLLR